MVIGVVGYMITAKLEFIDAVLNASMILTGMGPVNVMPNDSAKWFASIYALYSGVAFLTTIGLFIAPIAHRFMHKLHLDE
jgi:ABC-type polysaccharide/polyol phosphate export permease